MPNRWRQVQSVALKIPPKYTGRGEKSLVAATSAWQRGLQQQGSAGRSEPSQQCPLVGTSSAVELNPLLERA